MEPSIKYKSTEKTGNGFKVKVTDDPIKTLFTLNSDTDISIAYTNTSHNEFREICQFFGAGTFNIKPYLRDEIKFSHVYQTAAVQDPPAGYVDICKLRALNFTAGKYQQTSPYIIFLNATQSSTAHNHYWYGQNEREEAANNRNLSDVYLVSDFEVNKAIFYATVRGYTKTEYDNYLATGTTVSDHDINLWDFIASPSDYYISHFGMVAQFTWNEDNSRWDAVHTNCRITPALLFNAGTAKGITNINNAYFAGTFSGSTETQMSSNVSQSVRHTSRTGTLSGKSMGQLYDQIIDSSWCIGSPIDLELDPDMIQSDWDNNNEATIAFSRTTDKKEYYTDYHYTLYGWEEYSWGYNYGTSEGVPCHCTKYEFHLQRLIKGESVSALMASCGVYVTDTGNTTTFRGYNLTPTSLKSSHIKLGEMLPDGSTSGVWINGPDLDEYTGPNKTGSIVHPGYNPSPAPPPSGDDEDNTDPIPTVGAPYASGLSRYYVTTAASPILAHISEAMGAWNLKDTGKDLYKNIISCKLIKSPAPIPVSGSEPFTVYGVTLQYEGSDITLPVVSDNPTASFGSYTIPRKFGDFRDYAPYTRCEIYLPYCGWTALPSHVVGRSVSVTYYTDIIAGTCKAVVYCNSNAVAEAAGVIGLDIPMVTENAGAKAEAVTMGLLAYGKAGLQTALGVGAAVATKGKAGVKTALSGLENVVSAYSQTAMAFNQNYTEINGKNGDGCCIAGISAIVIKIIRPKYGSNTTPPYVPAEYPHTVGYVSMKSMKVGSVTGLLVGANVDVSGIAGATDREKEIIKRTIENGIIVNAAPSP